MSQVSKTQLLQLTDIVAEHLDTILKHPSMEDNFEVQDLVFEFQKAVDDVVGETSSTYKEE